MRCTHLSGLAACDELFFRELADGLEHRESRVP